MTETLVITESGAKLDTYLSPEARGELDALGLDPDSGRLADHAAGLTAVPGRPTIAKYKITEPAVLNEAFDYELPSSFVRGLRVPMGEARLLLLSGTASIDDIGETVFPGDFAAQCLRTYRNLTGLLVSEEASWHDVIRTTCYLRDIERDYDTFNKIRTFFFKSMGLDPLPASTGIQARLCRSDLLVEIELMALVPTV